MIKGLDVLTNNLFASKKFFEIGKIEFKALTVGREEILARILTRFKSGLEVWWNENIT